MGLFLTLKKKGVHSILQTWKWAQDQVPLYLWDSCFNGAAQASKKAKIWLLVLASRALQTLKGWSRCRGWAVEAGTTYGRRWCCCTGSRRSIGDQREDWEECIPFQVETDDYAESELFGWNILWSLRNLGYFLTSVWHLLVPTRLCIYGKSLWVN